MWKNIVEPGMTHVTIWRMRIACWITKATNTLRLCNTLCSCDRASWVKRRERIPTRCNNIDIYCQFRCLILTTVSTCFGHLYAHRQEKKTTCYCIWGCLLVVLDVAGCGTVVLGCRVWALWKLLLELQY